MSAQRVFRVRVSAFETHGGWRSTFRVLVLAPNAAAAIRKVSAAAFRKNWIKARIQKFKDLGEVVA